MVEIMERELSLNPKRLCGIFGQKLLDGELQIVEKKRIYGRDGDGSISFVASGLLDPEKSEINILYDENTADKIKTVLHELYHYSFPQMSEEEVEEGCIALYEALNPRQRDFFDIFINSKPIAE